MKENKYADFWEDIVKQIKNKHAEISEEDTKEFRDGFLPAVVSIIHECFPTMTVVEDLNEDKTEQ